MSMRGHVGVSDVVLIFQLMYSSQVYVHFVKFMELSTYKFFILLSMYVILQFEFYSKKNIREYI